MKTQKEPISRQRISLIEEYVSHPEEVLFFDLETTGLSAQRASIYLIGAAACENGIWTQRQWFAQQVSEEKEILQAFLSYARPFRRLLHFNGTTFDLPFFQARCKKYGLTSFLPGMEQTDLYRLISPWKNRLKLANCKQKTLEEFLGIFRDDPFHGGQLIELYRVYTQTQDQRLCPPPFLSLLRTLSFPLHQETYQGFPLCPLQKMRRILRSG